MSHHHNPFDPRDPRSPAFFFTFIDNGGNRGRRGGSSNGGCGCLLIALLFGIVLAALTSH